MAIVMVAPGWLRLVPLLANLSLALPIVRGIVGVDVTSDLDPILHGIRLYLIYGGAGLFLLQFKNVSVPLRSWTDIQWFIGTALVAATIATATGLGLHLISGNMTTAEALSLVNTWWFGDALGAIVVPPMLVPALMATLRLTEGPWHWPKPTVFGWQVLAIGLAVSLGAMGPAIGANLWHLVIWPALFFALRGGVEQAACAVLLTCIITPAAAAIFDGVVDAGMLAVPLLATSIAALLVGAATSERAETAGRLELLVASRTAELEKANLLQRHLLRSLGHDLRQPVEAINLTLSGLGDRRDGPVVADALARVRQLGHLASDLLSRILIYARLDTGEVQPALAPVALADTVRQLRSLYDPLAQRRGIRLTWPETDLTVRSDRELLFQILSNHLDNAIRLTPEGGAVALDIELTATGIGLFVRDSVDLSQEHQSSRGGLGLRIVSEAARLIGAERVEDPNRRGVVLPNVQA